MNRFKDSVVVVTGAAHGIGKATCKQFCSEGASVIALDINEHACCDLKDDFMKSGYNLDTYVIDVSSENEVKQAVSKIIDTRGNIDVLINNAGIAHRANVIDTSLEVWNRIIKVNLTSVFLMCKEIIPYMQHNGGGVIVNISSGWGIVGGIKSVSYCASKGGIILLTKAMAIDHGPDNIRINCVCPGDTDTNMLVNESRQLGYDDNHLKNSSYDRPLGRIGKTSEIASVIAFLSSNEASFITGDSIIVDGGGLAGSS